MSKLNYTHSASVPPRDVVKDMKDTLSKMPDRSSLPLKIQASPRWLREFRRAFGLAQDAQAASLYKAGGGRLSSLPLEGWDKPGWRCLAVDGSVLAESELDPPLEAEQLFSFEL